MFPASLRNENTMEIRGRLGMDTRYSSRKQRLPHFLMRSGPLDPIRPDRRRHDLCDVPSFITERKHDGDQGAAGHGHALLLTKAEVTTLSHEIRPVGSN